MQRPKHILVTRQEIARSGSVRGAVEEALSLAALEMTPQAMTAYEAAGSGPTEADGAGIVVQVEVTSEEELREAVAAGAEAVVVGGANPEQAGKGNYARVACGCNSSSGTGMNAGSKEASPVGGDNRELAAGGPSGLVEWRRGE